MRVITYTNLKVYFQKHSDSKTALQDWNEKVKRAEWNSLSDIKNTFNSVDYVGNDRYVFNIKGNKFRLVVAINFLHQKIFIRFIGTHSEYDKIDCKTV